jgi:type IX secretion system PorP/SprF family membrane protein
MRIFTALLANRLALLTLLGLGSLPLRAQDPQLSQFYAAPLYLNPAFAGSALATRGIINYRNQWPNLNANFVTSMASVDHYFDKINSGVGLLLMNDAQFSNLRTIDVGLQYAYQLTISEQVKARAGIQVSYVNRSVDYYNLVFGDQLSPTGPTGSPSLDPVANTGPRINYVDFSTGGLVYSEQFWVGLSVHHFNRPNQAFTTLTEQRLPMKIGIQGGYKFALGDWTFGNGLGDSWGREKSFSPAILYKRQGKFDQLDVGAYLTYAPLTFGLWYRGIPIKQYERGLNNHDAAVFLIGYRQDNFSFGYSYDATISTLGFSSGGAHEISMSYTLESFFEPKRNARRKKKEMACPRF